MHMARPGIVGLLVTHDQRMALALAPQSAWQDRYGELLMPLALPNCPCPADENCQTVALALAPTSYGQAADALPTQWKYGPSARHAIDREPASTGDPFLMFEREVLAADATHSTRTTLVFAVYRAHLTERVVLDARVVAAVLWVSVTALRALIGGERVADVVARGDVSLQLAAGVALPDAGLLYVPSDVGERSLARIAAKYGEGALFSPPVSHE